MKQLNKFRIDIFNLTLKQHEFEFAIDNSLFEAFEHSLVEKGSGKCHLTLDKTETMMTLNFKIEASVELACDRSLDEFDFPIKLEEQLIIKFGSDNYALSEDVIVIKEDTASLNVGDYIYEYISLAIPLKKLHPRYEAIEDEQPDLIYTSQKDEDDSNKNDQLDPRWEALKKLKGNK